MNMAEIAKERGAKPVNLKLERQAIYASKSGSNFNVTNVKALRLEGRNGTHYFWGNVAAFRHSGSDFLNSDKAKWLVIDEAA